MQIEVSQEVGIGEMPHAAGSVGHRIHWARNVMQAGDVAMGPLVVGIEPQEIGPGKGGGGGALGGPGDRGAVVANDPQCTLLDGAVLGQDVLVGDRGSHLQVRGDKESAARAVRGDQGGADGSRESLSPDDGSRVGREGVKPDAAHTCAARITGANVGRGNGNQLPKTGRALAKRGRHPFEIVDAVEDVLVEA